MDSINREISQEDLRTIEAPSSVRDLQSLNNTLPVKVNGVDKYVGDVVYYNSDLNAIINDKNPETKTLNIKRIQAFLKYNVDPNITIDGVYNKSDETAVNRYRKEFESKKGEMADFQSRFPEFRALLQKMPDRFDEIKQRASLYVSLKEILNKYSEDSLNLDFSNNEYENLKKAMFILANDNNKSFLNNKVSTRISGINGGHLSLNFLSEEVTLGEYISMVTGKASLVNRFLSLNNSAILTENSKNPLFKRIENLLDAIIARDPSMVYKRRDLLKNVYSSLNSGNLQSAVDNMNALTRVNFNNLTVDLSSDIGLARGFRDIHNTDAAGTIMADKAISQVDSGKAENGESQEKLNAFISEYTKKQVEVLNSKKSLIDKKFNLIVAELSKDPNSEYYHMSKNPDEMKKLKDGIANMIAFDETIKKVGSEGLGKIGEEYDDMKGLYSSLTNPNFSDEQVRQFKAYSILLASIALSFAVGPLVGAAGRLASSTAVRAGSVGLTRVASGLNATSRGLSASKNFIGGRASIFVSSASFALSNSVLNRWGMSQGDISQDMGDFLKSFSEDFILGLAGFPLGKFFGKLLPKEASGLKLALANGAMLTGTNITVLYLFHLYETGRFKPNEEELEAMIATIGAFAILGTMFPLCYNKLISIRNKRGSGPRTIEGEFPRGETSLVVRVAEPFGGGTRAAEASGIAAAKANQATQKQQVSTYENTDSTPVTKPPKLVHYENNRTRNGGESKGPVYEGELVSEPPSKLKDRMTNVVDGELVKKHRLSDNPSHFPAPIGEEIIYSNGKVKTVKTEKNKVTQTADETTNTGGRFGAGKDKGMQRDIPPTKSTGPESAKTTESASIGEKGLNTTKGKPIEISETVGQLQAGTKFEGDFKIDKNGIFSGNGKVTLPDGTRLIGDFEFSRLKNGYSIGLDESFSVYKKGEIISEGKIEKGLNPNPEKGGAYELSDDLQGLPKGTVVINEGGRFSKLTVENNQLIGKGTVILPDGTILKGTFSKASSKKANFDGEVLFSDGATFNGKYNYIDGKAIEGTFTSNGITVNGKINPNSGKFEGVGKDVNGKQIFSIDGTTLKIERDYTKMDLLKNLSKNTAKWLGILAGVTTVLYLGKEVSERFDLTYFFSKTPEAEKPEAGKPDTAGNTGAARKPKDTEDTHNTEDTDDTETEKPATPAKPKKSEKPDMSFGGIETEEKLTGSEKYVNVSTRLNIRNESGEIIGKLAKGEKVSLTGEYILSSNGMKFYSIGEGKFVSEKYLSDNNTGKKPENKAEKAAQVAKSDAKTTETKITNPWTEGTDKYEAYKILTTEEQKWLGNADPTDEIILARMRASLGNKPAEKTVDRKDKTDVKTAETKITNPWAKGTADYEAYEKLTPEEQKWLGNAKPTDEIILARMRASLGTKPAEKTVDRKDKTEQTPISPEDRKSIENMF